MVLWVGDENITYRLFETMRHFLDFDDTCYFLDITDELVDNYTLELIYSNSFAGWLEEEGINEVELKDDEPEDKSST